MFYFCPSYCLYGSIFKGDKSRFRKKKHCRSIRITLSCILTTISTSITWYNWGVIKGREGNTTFSFSIFRPCDVANYLPSWYCWFYSFKPSWVWKFNGINSYRRSTFLLWIQNFNNVPFFWWKNAWFNLIRRDFEDLKLKCSCGFAWIYVRRQKGYHFYNNLVFSQPDISLLLKNPFIDRILQQNHEYNPKCPFFECKLLSLSI